MTDPWLGTGARGRCRGKVTGRLLGQRQCPAVPAPCHLRPPRPSPLAQRRPLIAPAPPRLAHCNTQRAAAGAPRPGSPGPSDPRIPPVPAGRRRSSAPLPAPCAAPPPPSPGTRTLPEPFRGRSAGAGPGAERGHRGDGGTPRCRGDIWGHPGAEQRAPGSPHAHPQPPAEEGERSRAGGCTDGFTAWFYRMVLPGPLRRPSRPTSARARRGFRARASQGAGGGGRRDPLPTRDR